MAWARKGGHRASQKGKRHPHRGVKGKHVVKHVKKK